MKATVTLIDGTVFDITASENHDMRNEIHSVYRSTEDGTVEWYPSSQLRSIKFFLNEDQK